MRRFSSVTLFATLLFTACGSAEKTMQADEPSETKKERLSTGNSRWKGGFSNGMKGDKLSFDMVGKEVKELTFQGYWRCNGKLEQITIGPEKNFSVKGNTVEGTIVESGFYYDLRGTFNGNKASGTLRIAFTAGGCDTYKLNWTAGKQ